MTPPARLPAATVRQLLLLRALETASPESLLWTAQDRTWATRAARESLPPDAGAERFLAARAQHAMQRLRPRLPQAAPWLEAPLGAGRWAWLPITAAAVLGLLADTLVRASYVDLLAPPMWAVVAWNCAVYALLLNLALRRRGAGAGLAWWRHLVHLGRPPPSSELAELKAFARAWSELASPALQLRLAAVLHAAAAALALGLLAGLYARGLVLDYRAGWQSTFLDAPTVRAWLAWWLAPASRITGIALPASDAIAALRVAPGLSASAPAAPWIHLLAASLALYVIVPRAVLASMAAMRAGWLERHCPLTLDEPYFQELLRQQSARSAAVQLVPHAAPLAASSVLALRSLLARELGDDLQLKVAPTVPYGDEDTLPLPGADACSLRAAVFDLGATPEPEVQGRLVQRLRAQTPATRVLVLTDESAFRRRFGGLAERLAARRAAWREFAAAQGVAWAGFDAEPNPSGQDLDTLRRALRGVAADTATAGAP